MQEKKNKIGKKIKFLRNEKATRKKNSELFREKQKIGYSSDNLHTQEF